jgi:hypothetical protein
VSKSPLFIWKLFGHNFSHFLGQILWKICQPKVKKVDNPSQFGIPCIPSLFKPGCEFVRLKLPIVKKSKNISIENPLQKQS